MDFFRNFFGLGGNRTYDNHEYPFDDWNDFSEQPDYWSYHRHHEDPEEYHGDSHRDPFSSFGFHFFTEPHDMFRHFERQFREMFRDFGRTDFPPDMDIEPHTQLPPPDSGNLRDRMLKGPDSPEVPSQEPYVHPPKLKQDNDLDDKVASGDLGDILDKLPHVGSSQESPRGTVEPFTDRQHYSGKSVIVQKTFRDGICEERRTIRDSSGNEETTISRQMGDKSYSVTTKKSVSGDEEKVVTYNDMDADDVKRLDKEWNDHNTFPPNTHPDTSLPRIFGGLFRPWF